MQEYRDWDWLISNNTRNVFQVLIILLFAVVLSEFGAFSSSETPTNVVKEYKIYVNGNLSDAQLGQLGTITDDIKLGSTAP